MARCLYVYVYVYRMPVYMCVFLPLCECVCLYTFAEAKHVRVLLWPMRRSGMETSAGESAHAGAVHHAHLHICCCI